MLGRPRRRAAGALLVALILGACADAPRATPASPPPAEATPGLTPAPAEAAPCPAFDGRPLRETLSAETVVLSDGGGNEPRVEAAIYPHPDYEPELWSQWGQGLVLPDGRFLSAIGDHKGADGNSFVYQYAPETGRLTLVTDILSLTDHRPGDWGYGKIHGQMVAGQCGEVYFTTYWGTRDDLVFSPSYQGDRLFRMDPRSMTIADLGVPVEHLGVPSLAGWMEDGLLYGEAVDPASSTDRDQGAFFAYDVNRDDLVFRDDDPAHVGFRSVAIDADGRAYFSLGSGELAVFDPDTGEVRSHPHRLPGNWLRASTPPAPDGTVYGVTEEPPTLFALEPSGRIRTLGSAGDYTASLALSPDGRELFYVPGAHGSAWQQGTPLVRVDTRTGESTVVVRLNELAEEGLGLRLGGTYNVALDASRRVVYLGMNAGPPGEESAFGEVVLVAVHLP
jgi:sugar lactone lactonase YvrE